MTTCGPVTKSLLLLAVVVALTGQGSAAIWKPIECCTRVSRKEITDTITNYMVQRRNNHCVNAIIFQTESGGLHCSKHEPWMMKKVRQLMAKKRATLASIPSLLKLITSSSSTIGVNHRHALNALYRPIEMHLIQRRPMSSKILLKRKTMNF